MANETQNDEVQPERGRAGDVKSSLRTLEILEFLSSATSRQSIATMSRELRIPKSSLHGILRTMHAHGWLETDSTGTLYGLGLRALLAGTAYVESDDIVALAQQSLDLLAERTGEAVHLGRLDGDDVVYLAKRESTHALRLYSAVGKRLPAHATALGKSLLATLTPADVDRRLSWPLQRLTPKTITDADELHRDLAATRARGYAIDDGENTLGIRCVAVALPVVDGGRNAISCSVPETRMSPEREEEIVAAVQEAVQSITALISRIGGARRAV